MNVRDFDFDLPPELIAQEPSPQRGASRMLFLNRAIGTVIDETVAALPEHLGPGDLLVVNDTRVFPARLLGRRVPSGGAVECLLTHRVASDATPAPGLGARGAMDGRAPGDDQIWEALMHPGQK